MTTAQMDRLENWCQDFDHFFGWPITIQNEGTKTVVAVNTTHFHYTIEAQGEMLHCLMNDRQSGETKELTGGCFDFQTFGRIMMGILQCEAGQKKIGSLDLFQCFKRSSN